MALGQGVNINGKLNVFLQIETNILRQYSEYTFKLLKMKTEIQVDVCYLSSLARSIYCILSNI